MKKKGYIESWKVIIVLIVLFITYIFTRYVFKI